MKIFYSLLIISLLTSCIAPKTMVNNHVYALRLRPNQEIVTLIMSCILRRKKSQKIPKPSKDLGIFYGLFSNYFPKNLAFPASKKSVNALISWSKARGSSIGLGSPFGFTKQ